MRWHDVQCRKKVALLLQDLVDNRRPSGFADALDGFMLQRQSSHRILLVQALFLHLPVDVCNLKNHEDVTRNDIHSCPFVVPLSPWETYSGADAL